MFSAAALSLALASVSSADVQVGLSRELISAAPGQTIDIIATATNGTNGNDATTGIFGLDIAVQSGNGGADNGFSSNVAAPITSLTLTDGIFATNNGGNNGLGYSSDHFLAADSVTATSGTAQVPANSVLGTLTFDATGLAGKTFALYFYDVGQNDTNAPFFGDGTAADADFSDYNSGTGSFAFSGNYLNNSPTTAYGSAPLEISVVAVPEPATALVGLALTGLALQRRRRA